MSGCSPSSPVARQSPGLGWVDRQILREPENRDFQARYDTVRVDSAFLPLIGQSSSGVEVIVFLGTWCSDSKREVPHFLKIADAGAIPEAGIRLYCLDRSKKSTDGMTEKFSIERVPTFVFLRGGHEIGRITESPRATLEGDILAILVQSRQDGR